jgi:hypothetical protein
MDNLTKLRTAINTSLSNCLRSATPNVCGLAETANGYIQVESMIVRLCMEKGITNSLPLTQAEIAQYDTWFTMHPEKVCGKQVGGSGFSFPVKTLGTRSDIENTIDQTLMTKMTVDKPEVDDLELLELEAEALKIKLLLAA